MSLTLPYFDKLEDLRSLNFDNFQPFRLSVQGEELFCQQVLRLVRRRRLVVQGVWGGHNIIAKLFYHPQKAKLHFSRECWGHDQLKQADIPVAEMLQAVYLDAMPQVFVVIYKQLYPIKSLSDLLKESSPSAAWSSLQQCQALLVNLYKHGLCQADMHCNNFALVNDTMYALDYTTVRPCTGFKVEKCNLAAFYASLPLCYQDYYKVMFEDYCRQRGLTKTAKLYKQIQNNIATRRWHKAKRLLTTCTRASKGFRLIKQKGYRAVYTKSEATPALLELMRDPEAVLQKAPTKDLKLDHTTTVLQVKLDGQWFVVKRYNVKGWWHFLTHCWRRSRAMKTWRSGCLLQYFNIPTATPVAMIEKRYLGLTAQNYVVMPYLPGETLDHYLQHTSDPHNVLVKAAMILKQLASLKMRHSDLKAPNFIVTHQGVYLIDIDAMRMFRYNQKWLKVFKEELQRFRWNWHNEPKLLQVVDQALASLQLSHD